jgi:hypothetical protein
MNIDHDFKGLSWKKSSRSSSNGQCVETAETPDLIAVRDSKNPDGGMLTFEHAAWTSFVEDVKGGQFDL